MNEADDLVLDANILIRAVFGRRVTGVLEAFMGQVNFFCPAICLDDARRHIHNEALKHDFDPGEPLKALANIAQVMTVVSVADYSRYESFALERIQSRDPSDWPIVATCLLLDAPLWTEDRDFFGCGLATWTTNHVGIYLRGE